MHTSQIHHGKGIGTLAVHSAIGLALVILFGCDSGRDQPLAPDNSESGPDGVTTAQLGVSYPASSAQRRLTFDGQMLEIGARVPGFAGMHLDTLTGEIVILLTSAGLPGLTSSQRIADAAIHVRAFLHPSLRTANLKHEPAEYSFGIRPLNPCSIAGCGW
jgi:hypothetical protein